MRIRLLPEAERDLEVGADFYESQKAGLGVYFNDCLASDIESLKLYAGIHENSAASTAHFPNDFRFQSTIY